MSKNKTIGLINAAKKKNQDTIFRVEATINQMLSNKKIKAMALYLKATSMLKTTIEQKQIKYEKDQQYLQLHGSKRPPSP